jgi:hypothetical protein
MTRRSQKKEAEHAAEAWDVSDAGQQPDAADVGDHRLEP